MKKIAAVQSLLGGYVAGACVVWCFDDRFTEALKAVARGYTHYDLVRIAGGANRLAGESDEAARAFVLEQVRASIRLHQAREVVLMCHADCLACGGSAAFAGGAAKEREARTRDLREAAALLAENGVETPVRLLYVDFDAVWELENTGA
jgi:hypothetical protein